MAKRADQIRRNNAKQKLALQVEDPTCRLCWIGEGSTLMHKIRKSYSIELQDDPRNLTLACMRCHQLFDDEPKQAQELPGFWAIMDDIKELDKFYYNRLIRRINED